MTIGLGRQLVDIYVKKPIWLAAGLALAGALFVAATLEANRQERVRLAAFRADIADQTKIYETVISNTLKGYDDTLLALREIYLLHDPEDLADHIRVLRSGHLADPEILVVYADRQGFLGYTDTPGAKKGMSLADRPWFRFFAEGGKDRLYVDEPTFGRVTKRYTLPLSRPVYDKAGTFLGAVALSVTQRSLLDFDSRLQLSDDLVLTIINRGGTLVSSSRDLDRMHGTTIPAPLLARMLAEPEGILTGTPEGDTRRVIAYRHFLDKDIPLIITVEGSTGEALRQIALQRRVLLAGAAFTSFVILALIAVYLKGRETSLQLIDTLRRSKEQEYETLTGTTLDGFFVGDLSGRILDTNETLCRMLGYSREEFLSLAIEDLEQTESTPEAADRIRQAISDGSTRFQSRLRCRMGKLVHVEISAQFIGEPDNLFFVFVHDITNAKQAEEERKSHLRFLENLEKVDRAMRLETDPEQMLWKVVQTVFTIFDCDRAWLLYPCNPEAPTFRVPVEVARPEYPGAKVLDMDVPLSVDEAESLREAMAADGPIIYTEGTDRPVSTAEMFGVRSQMFVAVYPRIGEPWVFGMHQCSHPRLWTDEEKNLFNEIGRRLADSLSSVLYLRELQENESRFRATFEQAAVGIANVAADGRWLRVNRKLCDIVGYSREELLRKKFQEITHPDDLEFDMANVRRILAGKIDSYSLEKRYIRKNGSLVWIYLTVSAVRQATDGRLENFIAVIEDITDRKRAEEENARLENQLQQAQKMEAIGQLAGGVAHDFNNMLGVIIGHAELAMETLARDQQVYGDLEQILAAAQRSSEITRQLLAFARKQEIVPKIIDLNAVVRAILKMLRRLIGEDIELVWKPGDGLWSVKMDPAQIDQILANLCVNARAAIAGIGRIEVETANSVFDEEYCAAHVGFVPGEYVRLTVSDTGCGMSREILPHIFEPFFTTKEIGQGTGLGLSTVYGAVKQNNGFINVYSEPEKGSTFKIYLPRYRGVAGAVALKEGETLPGGVETILLVEDEPTILAMTTTMLQRLGYTVLPAAGPREALEMAEKTGAIDLLVTDVIMPGMNGRDLAAMLLAVKPGLKCLFMSGYTADIIATQGVLDEKVSFVQKPFTKAELAARVRQVLDQKEGLSAEL